MRPKLSIICVQCRHADGFLHLRVRYGHITKMAEAMAAAITVCLTHQLYLPLPCYLHQHPDILIFLTHPPTGFWQ